MTSTRTIRIEEEAYQKIKTLSEKYDLTLSDVITFLHDTKIEQDQKTEVVPVKIISASK